MNSYSNGWGHLIATLAVIGAMAFLIWSKSVDVAAALGLLSPVVAFWFMSGAVNRFQMTPIETPTVQTHTVVNDATVKLPTAKVTPNAPNNPTQ